MPKDAFTRSDVREPMLTVVCLPCGRRGRYNVERLIAKHGARRRRTNKKLTGRAPRSHTIML
jgi:RNase P subunit RPR2